MSDGRKFDHTSNAPAIGILLCIALIIASLVLGVITVGKASSQEHEVAVAKALKRLTLPQSCAHLYNVGRSKEWFECMGVGRK